MSKPLNTLPNPVLSDDPQLSEPGTNGEQTPPQPARVTLLNRRSKPKTPEPPGHEAEQNEDNTSSRVERVQDEAEAKLVRDELKEALDFIRVNQFGNAVVEVLRRRQGESEHSYLGELPCADFSLKTLAEIYGGGNFRLGIKSNGKYVRRVQVVVNQQLRGSHDREIEKQNATPPAPVVPVIAPKDDTVGTILALSEKQATATRESNERFMMLFAELQKSSAASNAQIIAALAGRQEAKGPGIVEIITALSPLLAPVLTAVLNKPDQIDMIMKLKDVFQTEPQPEEQMLDKLLRVGAPLAQQFMSRGQPQMQPAPMPVQAQPEAAPGLPSTIPALPPGIPVGMATESVQVAMAVRGHLPSLVGMASRGGAIDWIVPMVENSMNDAQLEHLDAILLREDWRAVLFGDAPEVTTAYRPWFDALRDAFLQDDGQEVAT